jgi:hypothetical protein
MNKFFSKEAFAVLHFRDFRLFLAYLFFMTTAVLMQVQFFLRINICELNISKTYQQLLYVS